MPVKGLPKQSMDIPFIGGADTKTDPFRVAPGKFLARQNSVFQTSMMLQKRNGFGTEFASISAKNLTTLTTFGGNLTAVGTSLYAYNQTNATWLNKGSITPVQLSTMAAVRTSTAQQTVDIATIGTVTCVVWKDSGGTNNYKLLDSQTGQVIVASTSLPSSSNSPRVFAVGKYFIVTFTATVSATPHLQYIAIPVYNPTSPTAATDISTAVSANPTGYDGQVINGQLYIAWNASDVGGAVRITYIDSTLTQHSVAALTSTSAPACISVTGDTTQSSPVIYVSFIDGSNNGWTASFSSQLVAILAKTQIITGVGVFNLTSYATGGVCTVYYETNQNYSYANVRSDYISSVTCTAAGVVGSPSVILRSVGIASKAFQINGTTYMLVAYNGSYQPTYFLIDGAGNIIAKLAYANGGGYPSGQVFSNAIVSGQSVQIGYLYKDQLLSVNKSQTGAVGGIFSETGINLATFTLADNAMPTAEIAQCLHLGSGFLWQYDGVKPVEHGFFVWPEDIVATTSTVGGNMTAQVYYYQWTYEWTDSQGNIHRSAPSVPLKVDLSGSGTSTNSVTINIPYLRLTYKTSPNSVRIMGWRWSTANQSYYQITSVTSPTLNSTTADSVTYTDTQADTAIVGNPLIYTTGGVLEDIAAPAINGLCLFNNRMVLMDAEDENLLWYSKSVVENTPVELSDLQTIYVAPTSGAQTSTGANQCVTAMDDKLIIFKRYAPYFVTGQGPDNTGSNNDFTDPILINSPVSCSNSRSFALIPNGLMFQANDSQGIWLLRRDLGVEYIGAEMEAYNSATVLSAVKVPGTTQVRFTLDSGITLMYDYYYNQWDTFNNIPAISSTIYQNLHTYLDSSGRIFQETEGKYLDGSSPVLQSFKTGWFSLGGIQGFQRAYWFTFLGTFISPHKLKVDIAYDYDPSIKQSTIISPDNYSAPWGGDTVWGGSSKWGGNSNVEQWRIFLTQQKCQAFQITVTEIFDPSYGTAAGAGFTMTGINLTFSAKGNYPRLTPSRSAS